jgi:hypothetical protein
MCIFLFFHYSDFLETVRSPRENVKIQKKENYVHGHLLTNSPKL